MRCSRVKGGGWACAGLQQTGWTVCTAQASVSRLMLRLTLRLARSAVVPWSQRTRGCQHRGCCGSHHKWSLQHCFYCVSVRL
jgi:hypothetical protein